MKKSIVLLLALLPFVAFAGNKNDFVANLCSNQKILFHFNGVEFDSSNNDDVPTAFGTAAHRGVTKNFDKDSAVTAIISDALKQACSRVERSTSDGEGALNVNVSCNILSVTSTVEETRGGSTWGGVWASIKLNLSIVGEDGHVYYQDKVISEGRSRGGFNINLSSVEDAANRLACFLSEDFRVVFPVSGEIIEPYTDPKSSKTAFIVGLGSNDNVYSGGLATFRVSRVVEESGSFKLVEIGSGYIFDVLDQDRSIFRITYGSGAVKKAYEAGDTLIIRSR